MKLLCAAIAALLASSPLAWAQQPAQPQQPASEQALGNRLMNEIGNNLQCQAALITAQRELEELKKKHDEKPSAAPPPAK